MCETESLMALGHHSGYTCPEVGCPVVRDILPHVHVMARAHSMTRVPVFPTIRHNQLQLIEQLILPDNGYDKSCRLHSESPGRNWRSYALRYTAFLTNLHLPFYFLTANTGLITSFNTISIPAVALAPTDLLVRQFAHLYYTGRANMPPLAILSATCFGFLAYSTRRSPKRRFGLSQSSFYLTAAVLLPMIVPFTVLIMEPGPNKPLLAWAAEAEAVAAGTVLAVQRSEVQRELGVWIGMNYVRAGLVGTGALLGAAAVALF
nr:putative mitochondrial membrane protein [Quercus suber]